MVDSASLVQRIVVETISFVQELSASHVKSGAKSESSTTKKPLTNLLRLCKNFLSVLDEQKSMPYKLAIVDEFLEAVRTVARTNIVSGFDTLENNVYRMQQYIQLIQTEPEKQQILLAQVTAAVNHFIDPNSLQPPTVIFWLKEPCTMHVLKKMQTLMLFLPKSLHVKVLQHDTALLHDKKIQFLLECISGI